MLLLLWVLFLGTVPVLLLLPELGCINVGVRGLIEVNTTTTAAIAIGTTSTTSCLVPAKTVAC